MKTIQLLLSLTLLVLNTLSAQNPVQWTFYTKKITDNKIELYYNATIDSGWKLYARENEDTGPVLLTFTTEQSYNLKELESPIATSLPIQIYDQVFNMPLRYYMAEATFKQVVQVNQNIDTASLAGYLTYMVCNHNKCLPPTDLDYNFCFAKRPTKTYNGQPIKSIRVGHCTSLPSQD